MMKLFFRLHRAHSLGLEEASKPEVAEARLAWTDMASRAEILRTNRRARVQRRARRLLTQYKLMQSEATAMALMKMQAVLSSRPQGITALAHVRLWCKDNTRGAEGLDVPGMRSSKPGAFMTALAEAKGGYISGHLWGKLMIPERHQDMMAQERAVRGHVKKPRLTGDVDDAP